MAHEQNLLSGSTTMLLMKLIEKEDMYGYQMIEELARRSDKTFSLKAGTLYPLLHDMEKKGYIRCYEAMAETGRVRKYYSLTKEGHAALVEKQAEWETVAGAVNKVLAGGVRFATTG